MHRILTGRLRRPLALAGTGLLATALAGAALTVAPTAGARVARVDDRGAREVPTPFAFRASGYGTRLQGGDAPADSQTTAFNTITCTNLAGRARDNDVTEADLQGNGTLSGAKTRVWTTSRDGVVAAWSRQSVAELVLLDSSVGELRISGISALARAFHDAEGFHTKTATDVAAIEFHPADGSDPQSLPIPAPGQPVTVPGLATIAVGDSTQRHNGHVALAFANALRVHVIPTNTTLRVAHTTAQLTPGVRSGLFHGFSAGVEGNAADGTVTFGRNPLSLMPCEGTGGDVRTKAVTEVNPDDNVDVGEVTNSQTGRQTATVARGYERSEVSTIKLGDGQLLIDGVIGQANVIRDKRTGKVTRTAAGTSIGTVTANGEPQTFPGSGVLEIPGVARLEPGIVERTRTGIHVIGLRVTLLDGSGAVFDFAQAWLGIKPSGL